MLSSKRLKGLLASSFLGVATALAVPPALSQSNDNTPTEAAKKNPRVAALPDMLQFQHMFRIISHIASTH